MAELVVRPLTRSETREQIGMLAQLRMTVFREFPYLYDGDESYERDYLQTYLSARGAFLAGAFDGANLVGACTATPLSEHEDEFGAPFAQRGLDLKDYFYFGESVLLPDYRGRGAGVRFFELREEAARRQQYRFCIFSSVLRAADHPARPEGYEPLDNFWRNRGYERMESFRTHFSWPDIGESRPSRKAMEYWIRDLSR